MVEGLSVACGQTILVQYLVSRAAGTVPVIMARRSITRSSRSEEDDQRSYACGGFGLELTHVTMELFEQRMRRTISFLGGRRLCILRYGNNEVSRETPQRGSSSQKSGSWTRISFAIHKYIQPFSRPLF